MSIDAIFYTQISTIVVFVMALFGIYRLLVSQKDSVIELLREQIRQNEAKMAELNAQSPDILARTLSDRIEIATKEIERLKLDGDNHKEEIKRKEAELNKSKEQMMALAELITETNLICPHCNAPLSERAVYPIYGEINGREYDADAEYSAYECGLIIRDGVEESPCKNSP